MIRAVAQVGRAEILQNASIRVIGHPLKVAIRHDVMPLGAPVINIDRQAERSVASVESLKVIQVVAEQPTGERIIWVLGVLTRAKTRVLPTMHVGDLVPAICIRITAVQIPRTGFWKNRTSRSRTDLPRCVRAT